MRIRSRVAGLDVHRDTVVACCQVEHPNQSIEVTKQSFSTTSKLSFRTCDAQLPPPTLSPLNAEGFVVFEFLHQFS